MDLKKLFGMRPKTEAIPDIEAALAAARAAGEAAARAEAALLAKRGDVLLTGTPEEVTRAEEALTRARAEAEHVATMVPILEARLKAAERQPFLEDVRRRIDELEALHNAFRNFLAKDYPEHARRIAEGLALEVRIRDLHDTLRGRFFEMTPAEREVYRVPARPTVWDGNPQMLAGLVVLPNAGRSADGAGRIWPDVPPPVRQDPQAHD